jgi:hypothetical protein
MPRTSAAGDRAARIQISEIPSTVWANPLARGGDAGLLLRVPPWGSSDVILGRCAS